MTGEICGDNRFEIIERVKKHLLDGTNIYTHPEEVAVLDSVLFRLWQLGEIGERTNESLEEEIAHCYHNIEYKERCIFNLQDENRKLRYERLMWKANFFREVKVTELHTRHPNKSWHKLAIQTERIAEALEERARKIKEEM